jgi:hypothetical protein
VNGPGRPVSLCIADLSWGISKSKAGGNQHREASRVRDHEAVQKDIHHVHIGVN